jgi:RNA 2',3'-cyclic 3'-phosphodiesterase
MSERLRSFIAVRIPASAALRPVVRELAEMGRAVKSVDPDHLHVTLKFLGDVNAERMPEISSILQTAAAAQCRCELTIAGLGVFPHAQRPNVVWAGLEGAQVLQALAAELQSAFEPLGFAREDRPFVPHLTLARIKARPPQSLHELLARHQKTRFGTATVESVELFRSDLGPEGPKHTVLSSAPLGVITGGSGKTE